MNLSTVMAETELFSIDRVIRRSAWVVLAVSGIWVLKTGSWVGFWCLTGAGLVTMINLRWLEAVVVFALVAGGPRVDFRTAIRYQLRLLLLAVLFAALWVADEWDPVALAAGFTIPLAVLVFEGMTRAAPGEEG